MSSQLHAPAALPQRKSPWYPLHRSLCGPQGRSGHGGEEDNSQPLLGLKLTIIQPVAQSYFTALSRLLRSCCTEQNSETCVLVAQRNISPLYVSGLQTILPCLHAWFPYETLTFVTVLSRVTFPLIT
jgi:hypothetical protein